MKALIKKEYGIFLNEIKSRIVSARIQAVRRVNKELINLYWDIGKSIVERQERFSWGKGVVEKLASDLAAEFNKATGFSVQNLWRMRLLYLGYKDKPKLAQLVREIPWGQNIAVFRHVQRVQMLSKSFGTVPRSKCRKNMIGYLERGRPHFQSGHCLFCYKGAII